MCFTSQPASELPPTLHQPPSPQPPPSSIQSQSSLQSLPPSYTSPRLNRITRFYPSNTSSTILQPSSPDNVHQVSSNNDVHNSSDEQNPSSQESCQASSLDDDNSALESRPSDNLPLSKELFEQYLDDEDFYLLYVLKW